MDVDTKKLRDLMAKIGASGWTSTDGLVWFSDGDSALIADPKHNNSTAAFLAFDNLGEWPEPVTREDVASFVSEARNRLPAILDALDTQAAEIARLREVLTELLGWQSTAPWKVIDEARAVLEQGESK